MFKKVKEFMTKKRIEKKYRKLRKMIEEKEEKWDTKFRKKWNRYWEEEEFPSLEETIMEILKISINQEEIIDQALLMLEDIDTIFCYILEKQKLKWVKELKEKGKRDGAKSIVIKGTYIPRRQSTIREFNQSVKAGKYAEIRWAGVICWVTFNPAEELKKEEMENWAVNKKLCSVEYIK